MTDLLRLPVTLQANPRLSAFVFLLPELAVSLPPPDSVLPILQGSPQVSPPPGSTPVEALEVGIPLAWPPLDAGSHHLQGTKWIRFPWHFLSPGPVRGCLCPSSVEVPFSPFHG